MLPPRTLNTLHTLTLSWQFGALDLWAYPAPQCLAEFRVPGLGRPGLGPKACGMGLADLMQGLGLRIHGVSVFWMWGV